jgi:type II secretion system (T2SS) protein M
MPALQHARRNLRILLGALLAVDLACIVILVSPVGHSRLQEIQLLQGQLRAKTREVEPLRGLDKKVVDAKQEIAAFYRDRLPGEYSQIYDTLGRLATENGAQLTQAKYHQEDTEGGGLRPITIDAVLSGDYIHVVKFINALERDKTLFTVNSIQLGDAQGGTVKLQLKMQTYLKSGTS